RRPRHDPRPLEHAGHVHDHPQRRRHALQLPRARRRRCDEVARVLDAFLDWLARLPTLPTYLVLMVLSALENVFPPVPADVAVALGAFLAQRGEVSAPLLGAVCWLANTASAAGMYYLGRARGAAFFASGWPRRLLPPEAMQALGEAYKRHGVAGIF